MDIATYTLPAHWAPALVNHDYTGLEQDDETALFAFLAHAARVHGEPVTCISCSEGGDDFRTYHDARDFGVLACNVLTYSFDVTRTIKREN